MDAALVRIGLDFRQCKSEKRSRVCKHSIIRHASLVELTSPNSSDIFILINISHA